ncbi:hypothetical protein [Actinacidiphila acididurans]|uniref:Uncharacterized protein n=1 Tax=Actinacidiphila acididurans TaxID=2784346 RepID=A0ABS2TNA8_9ACTN|nr:hypothetical protein [Actinacidiphila acididurans]MBM9504814.1 hypothetical protein [Actinacidiphila acididurans]
MSSEGPANHAMVFDAGTIYFIYSFSATRPLDVNRVADRLLSSEIAETSASPVNEEVRVAQRFRSLEQLLKLNYALTGANEAILRGRLLSWILRHPTQSTRLAWKFGRRSAGGSLPRSSRRRTIRRILHENADFIERSVAEAQMPNAIQMEIERDLLRPSYLDSEPYLRLSLKGSHIWLNIMNGGSTRGPEDESESRFVNVLLLLHASGVMQLVFVLPLPEHLTVEAYRDLCFGVSPDISAVKVAEPVLSGVPHNWRRRLAGSWDGEMEAGTRWRKIDFPEPDSITGLFDVYRSAIAKAGRFEEVGEFICYPATFIDELSCCSSKDEFMTRHRQDLNRVLARSLDIRRARENAVSAIVPEDTSLMRDTSFFANMASALEIRWPGAPPGEFAKHLQRLIVLEAALLQYWQIRTLAQRINGALIKSRDIRSIQREAIFGLQEYRYSSVTYGTAIDMIDALLSEWKVDKYYNHALESLDQLQQLAASDESNRSSRRANFLATLALIATIFMGLPAVKDTLDIAKEVPQQGASGALARPFRYLAERGDQGTWIGYVILLLAVIVAISIFGLSNHLPHIRWRRKPPGRSWPLGTVRITRIPDDLIGTEESAPPQTVSAEEGEPPSVLG